MAKKKILFTIPNFDTAGSGKVVLDLVRGLKNEFEIHVACKNDRGAMFQTIKKEAYQVHLFDFYVQGKPYPTLLKRIAPIRNFFRLNKFDLVHSWHYADDWTEALSARLVGIKYVFTKKSMSWGGKDWWLRSKLANAIITINQDMNRQFYPDWKKVVYMPLGLDLIEYSPLPSSRLALGDLPISDKDFVLMSIANMVPVKGIETAIEAVHLAHNPSIKYVLVGSCEASYKQKLDNLVLKHNLTNQVFFVGKQSDVKPYLAAADLFVIPTLNEGRKEGLPMAPIEAMACQRLVAGSRISGITDILAEFPNFIFEATNAVELKNVLEMVLAMSPAERASVASKMRIKTEENYSMEKFISGHISLYYRLLKNR